MIENNRPLDVLVIGAGIAGLSAAIALGKQGHHVVYHCAQILERSSFLRETGAAIHLPPNCTALLKWMGVDPEEFGGTIMNEIHRYSHAGELKYKKDFAGVRETWQAEWYLVHRVDLHNNLKLHALKTATLHTGCKITDVDINTSRPSVTLEDGRIFDADLLLGADGLHSQIRRSVAPGAPGPYAVGKSCYRWLLPTDKLRKHETSRGFVEDPGIFMEWATEGARLVAYPCSDNKVFNLCAFLPSKEAESSASQVDGWQTVGDQNAVVQGFADFHPGVQQIVQDADQNLRVWDLYDMEMLPTWTVGQTALIGDAAHPFQPYMGQGGAMAIEDAVGIATLLPYGSKASDIPSRLELYQSSRRPRVEMILNFTRLNGRDDSDAAGARITRKFLCFKKREQNS
ncbi:hypothetical protein N7462_000056 [Penicillium macrosclerotiorum]|uniref:uncharacterized protein n=1 Tax=Penicillium macrosclerotiorum TaxID=303699 RepID=UPI0025497C19|nr:uncharacterized protein N7462_000056 [Penicillium macrosclerotiorum]KAJ5698051.1 hypothetical protein N7462_000056 [Penicillium macrosclerotiorum]